jgi:hypothetical protein
MANPSKPWDKRFQVGLKKLLKEYEGKKKHTECPLCKSTWIVNHKFTCDGCPWIAMTGNSCVHTTLNGIKGDCIAIKLASHPEDEQLKEAGRLRAEQIRQWIKYWEDARNE